MVFGSSAGWPAEINASSLNGRNGFAINGFYEGDSGHSVSGAGDVNGDGVADILIGASGFSCVVFGQNQSDFNL